MLPLWRIRSRKSMRTPHGRNRGRNPANSVPATSRSFPSPAAPVKLPPSSPVPQNCNSLRTSCRPDVPGKKLVKAQQKAERTARKLEQAEGSLPARRKLRLEVEADAATGNAKRRLKFEKEVVSNRNT